MYEQRQTLKLHHTDAAGLLFFAHQFTLAHSVYEDFLSSLGIRWADLIRNRSVYIPIVHAESDFKKPLFVGDVLIFHLHVLKVSAHSYVIETKVYQHEVSAEHLAGTVKTVHVTMDPETKRKVAIPDFLRTKLEQHLA